VIGIFVEPILLLAVTTPEAEGIKRFPVLSIDAMGYTVGEVHAILGQVDVFSETVEVQGPLHVLETVLAEHGAVTVVDHLLDY
jgi:hypothetical protein